MAKTLKRDDKSAFASARAIRTSPRKANLVLQLIRGCHVAEALDRLTTCQKRVANEIAKVLESAISNAENNHNLDVDNLFVTEAIVGRAFVMKRFQARARGRGMRIVKPFSNVRIQLTEREEAI